MVFCIIFGCRSTLATSPETMHNLQIDSFLMPAQLYSLHFLCVFILEASNTSVHTILLCLSACSI